MGVIVGFVIGYITGTRAGQRGYEDLMGTVKQIAGSQQLRELLSVGASVVGEAVKVGTKALGNGGGAPIRRVA